MQYQILKAVVVTGLSNQAVLKQVHGQGIHFMSAYKKPYCILVGYQLKFCLDMPGASALRCTRRLSFPRLVTKPTLINTHVSQ